MRITITIRLDDKLLIRIRKFGKQTGKTLTVVIEDALRAALAREYIAPKKKKIILKTFKGKGLQPEVVLDHSSSLADLMLSDET